MTMPWTRLALAGAMTISLAGCAALAPRSVTVDRTGRDLARVDADILACWQQAEATHPPNGRQFLVAAALGPAGSVVDDAITGDATSRRSRVQGAAERCMVNRGYTVVRQSEP